MKTILELLIIIGCIVIFPLISILGFALFPIIFYNYVYKYYRNLK